MSFAAIETASKPTRLVDQVRARPVFWATSKTFSSDSSRVCTTGEQHELFDATPES